MRNDCKELRKAGTTHTQQAYHAGGNWCDRESYAFDGFDENLYWVSDRPEPLTSDWQRTGKHAGLPLAGYGIEMELECEYITNRNALVRVLDRDVFSFLPRHFKHQSDGSLGGNSSDEAISGVMRKSHIRNHYRDFKYAFDAMNTYKISASASGHCGMHVNISLALFGNSAKSQENNTKKLLYFVNRHYDLCVDLFARNREHTYYCARMDGTRSDCTFDCTKKDVVKSLDLHNMPRSHGNCCNYSHYDAGRVELRLVGGQSSYACFRNTMECVFHLVSAVNSLDWKDLDNLSKVFKGCNQYVFDRLTRCRTLGSLAQDVVDAVEPTIVREELI